MDPHQRRPVPARGRQDPDRGLRRGNLRHGRLPDRVSRQAGAALGRDRRRAGAGDRQRRKELGQRHTQGGGGLLYFPHRSVMEGSKDSLRGGGRAPQRCLQAAAPRDRRFRAELEQHHGRLAPRGAGERGPRGSRESSGALRRDGERTVRQPEPRETLGAAQRKVAASRPGRRHRHAPSPKGSGGGYPWPQHLDPRRCLLLRPAHSRLPREGSDSPEHPPLETAALLRARLRIGPGPLSGQELAAGNHH